MKVSKEKIDVNDACRLRFRRAAGHAAVALVSTAINIGFTAANGQNMGASQYGFCVVMAAIATDEARKAGKENCRARRLRRKIKDRDLDNKFQGFGVG